MTIEGVADSGDGLRPTQRRDARELTRIYDRHGRLLYALILRIVRSQAVAEDLVQETFLRFWNRARNPGEHECDVAPWLLAMARNRALDYVRSCEGRESTPAAGEETEDPRLCVGQAGGVPFAERAQRAKQALAQLPEEQRKAIELACFDSHSPTGMAGGSGQATGAVESSLRKALAAMRTGDGSGNRSMSCEELQEHYELYALGLAGEPERSEIHAHLDRRCAACESGFRRAIGLVAAISAAAPAAQPPARLRRRVLASVGVAGRHYGWPVAWAAAALLCFSATVYFSGRERQYAEESLRLRRQLGGQTAELRRAREALVILSAPGTLAVAFGEGRTASPAGRVLVNPIEGTMLIASGLPPAPPGRTYEMWIIPKGGPPRPAGLFQSHNDGAMHIEPGPVDAARTAAIAVTMENETGAAQPTSQPLIVATLPVPGR